MSDEQKQIILYLSPDVYNRTLETYSGMTNIQIIADLLRRALHVDYQIDKARLCKSTRMRAAQPKRSVSLSRNGKIAMAAWFPAQFVNDVKKTVRTGNLPTAQKGSTLHRILCSELFSVVNFSER